MEGEKIKIPTFEETKQQWIGLSDFYAKIDSSPQSFYFTLINMLDLSKAKSILEVGAGRCILLPQTFELKKKQASYLATDLSQKMLQLADQTLRNHFDRYQSKISFEQWLAQNNCVIRAANGEMPFNAGHKFDRIICNMVMMLTESAENMLQNLYNEAETGCLLGVSVWGDRSLNLMHPLIDESVRECGIEPPKSRSNFYLYNELGKMADKVGWKTVLCWEQTSVFPYHNTDQLVDFMKFSVSRMKYDAEKQQAIYDTFMKKAAKQFQEKKAMTFSAQIYIFRKQ